MRYIYSFSVAILLLFLLIVNGAAVNAVETGFITEDLSEEKRTTFLTNVEVSLLEQEPAKKAIECFDVSESGMIAIGQAGSERKKVVCIYSQDGAFVRGYSFNCSGAFAVEWTADNLNIYFVRSDVIAAVDSAGNLVDIAKVQDSIENNTYRNHHIYTNERVCGDTVYKLKNDMGILNLLATSYSQLVAVHPTGEETILYDVSSNQLIKYSIAYGIIAVIILVNLVKALGRYKRKLNS